MMNDNQNPFSAYANIDDGKTTPEQETKKEKRYFWIKLKEGFFDDKYIKAIRAQPNG